MTASFLLDTAGYYFVAVWPAYKKSFATLRVPPFGDAAAWVGFLPIRFYTRRLVRIAERRLALGTYGKRNAGRRPRLVGFSLGAANAWMFILGLAFWGRAEIEHAVSGAEILLRRLRRLLYRDLADVGAAFRRPPSLALRDVLQGNFAPLRSAAPFHRRKSRPVGSSS